jgi:hypothetical protein
MGGKASAVGAIMYLKRKMMSLCVYMCVCVCVYIYVCVYMYVCAYVHVREYIRGV